MTENKLSTEPYKGTRDFYPEEMALRKALFAKIRQVVESYGYVEYDSSPIEETSLYAAKSGEELVKEQTYSFTDRGGREVTLRPEMTPTVARMVAAKRRELGFPLRWYSIPNLFRYEQPQKGRLREHYQLNVDIFGVNSVEADIEIISIASEILKSFGAKENDFEIRVNNRKIMRALSDLLNITDETNYKLSKLIDKKDKMEKEVFSRELSSLTGNNASLLNSLLEAKTVQEFLSKLPAGFENNEGMREVEEALLGLSALQITNARFSPSLMRGFDYYTGIVFEVFDTSKDNRRSLFGGGRYDDLLSIFGEEKVPGIGFGMGDVTLKDFLETHDILPKVTIPTNLYICRIDEEGGDFVNSLAKSLREKGVKVAIDFTGRKLGDQIKTADKNGIRYVICIGENERKTNTFSLKELKTGKELSLSEGELWQKILNDRNSTV